ncbi:MAG: hypothetical protein J2P45_02450 [Candidatus Dormibacteraeota bacterium]|nr:hypothetical protein [Candidatus Dormibacteraeota bacterium]
MSVPNVVLPLLTTLASFAAAGMVLDQWRQRRRSFQLVWGLGLLFYGIGAGVEFLGAFGWDPVLYRLWFLFGAMLVAAYLGAGTVYLLSRTRFGYLVALSVLAGGLFAPLFQASLIQQGHPTSWTNVWLVVGVSAAAAVGIAYATARHRGQVGHVAMAILVAASLLAAVLVATAYLPPPGYALAATTRVPLATAMPGYLQVMTGPYNIAGGFSLVFGALFSLWAYLPKRELLRRPLATLAGGGLNSRVPATILIALGGFVPSLTSGLDRFGVTWSFYLGQLLGVLLIFAGLLVSEEVFARLRARGRGTPPVAPRPV